MPVPPPGPPGPPAPPLLGWRANSLRMAFDSLVYLNELYRRYGEVVTLARGTRDYIFAFRPENNHRALSDASLFHTPSVEDDTMPFKNPPGSAAERLAQDLNLINAERHKRQRRLMMPAFHKRRVETYRDSMVELTERKLSTWHRGEVRDIAQDMPQLALSIAVGILLGVDAKQGGDEPRLLLQRWVELGFSPCTILAPYDLPGLPFRSYLRVCRSVERFLLSLIRRKQKEGGGSDVLSMLLAAEDEDGSKMTHPEIAAQLVTLFVAGHETTAATLSGALFLLSRHPAVLADLMDELSGTLHGEAPRIDQFESLPLLENVIMETIRLLPPSVWAQRISTAPFDLGPYSFPARTKIIHSPGVTHRIPEFYPQPSRFIPSRWENTKRSLYEYLPFSAGPRTCIGASFPMTELKVVLPLILQRYAMHLAPGGKGDRVGFALSAPKTLIPKTPIMKLESPGQHSPGAEVRGNIRLVVDFD